MSTQPETSATQTAKTTKDFSKGLPKQTVAADGSRLRILIVHARWNQRIVDALVEGAVNTLVHRHRVSRDNIDIRTVPGSYELPLAAQRLLYASKQPNGAYGYDAVIAIGVLIKGQTMHFEYISESVSHGLMRVGLDTNIPIIFGVLTCLTDDQALARAGLASNGHNHGEDWGSAAVEMALLQ
jgi:6,7-dimethyl-8-ribityllumazine synthase